MTNARRVYHINGLFYQIIKTFQSKVTFGFSVRMSGGLVDYTLPKAALDEILIEKTPDYSLGQGLKPGSELIGISIFKL